MEERLPRKLAAILYADVAGYSRLTGKDEDATHRRLKESLDLISDTVASYHGRVMHYAGDAVLAMFDAVVDALCCAAAIQGDLRTHNQDVPDERKVLFRIGVNLGDVIEDRGDIYGDGVNIAARLESLAVPGGICISESVYTAVGSRLPLDYDDLGEQKVKNIDKPVRAYRAESKEGAKLPKPTDAAKRTSPVQWIGIAATITVLVGGGLLAWFKPWVPEFEPVSVDQMTYPLPDKPSIAVLPFNNMSDDPEQEYFADGITEDITTDLSKISGLFVIARNSAFAYKGKPVEPKDVARELGVRYVMEGSVRRAGDEVRVNAQLIDATTGGHVWAERYDGSVADIFSVQDDFTRKIVTALAVNLTPVEQEELSRNRTNDIAARDAFQKGWAHYVNFTPNDMAKAVPHFEKAVELDPNYSRAYAALGLVYFRGCAWRWHEPLGIGWAQAFGRASSYLERAEEQPTSLTNVLASQIYLYDHLYEKAFVEAERSIALDPNDPEGRVSMAWALITTGRAPEAVDFIEQAMRLDPRYPSHYLLARGVAYFAMEELEEAANAFKQAFERNSADNIPAGALAASYARLGQYEKARSAFKAWATGQEEKGLPSHPQSFLLPYKWPKGEQEIIERMTDGLNVAGLPAEVTIVVLSETLINSKKQLERLSAARTLGWFGPFAQSAAPTLVQALNDENIRVRTSAAQSLGKIGPAAAAAVPALIEILKDKNSLALINQIDYRYFRYNAVEALGRIGTSAVEAIPVLTSVQEEEPLRKPAKKALQKITQIE